LIEGGKYVPQRVKHIRESFTLLAFSEKLSSNASKFSQKLPEIRYEIWLFGSVLWK
jgi:hypothetical protein